MELQLLGPTLTITGVLFVLLRILFCSVPGCVDVSDDTSHHIEANVIDVREKQNTESDKENEIGFEDQLKTSYTDSPISDIHIDGSFVNIRTTTVVLNYKDDW